MSQDSHINATIACGDKEMLLSYDGSFSGFLCTIFYLFERKLCRVQIQKSWNLQPTFCCEVHNIFSDETKALRVWKGLQKKAGIEFSHQLYASFLSEKSKIEDLLYRVIIHIFEHDSNRSTDFGHQDILKVAQISKMVGREKHRMEAFVRFRLTKDEIYFSTIEPDFDVLPLIRKHFTSRYADQKWLIYDLKRKYGLFYDLRDAQFIELSENRDRVRKTSVIFHEDETAYEELWKNYFQSTNIAARKNLKLHIQHVPKRYWKYLSEKAPL